ncbi:MAG: ADP-ribosylglycohydrolase family protein [Bacteroidaceae bacterium]|nr:ADP-ribosylglycohydrolase family protein [Bacteroidaceae bacterium]
MSRLLATGHPVGWFCKRRQEVLEEAKKTALCTHGHPEGVKGAQTAALSYLDDRMKKVLTRWKESVIAEDD